MLLVRTLAYTVDNRTMIERPQLEARERTLLMPYAMCSEDSRGRAKPEPEDRLRTVYQRDRDRIIHAKAFRRLASKTQVYPFQPYDHTRTRLTHSLEVAQIGRTIARAVGCNEDLVEAICLAHDLGHPPLGHTGEKALKDLMQDVGGFDHQVHSYRLLTELEQRRPGQPGLNLTYEVLEGIQKHDPDFDTGPSSWVVHPEERATLEAQISNLADEIAYSSSDLDDYLRRAAPDKVQAVQDLALVYQVLERTTNQTLQVANLANSVERKQLISEVVDLFVTDCIKTTLGALETSNVRSLQDVRHHATNLALYSTTMSAMRRELREFLDTHFYQSWDVQKKTDDGVAMIKVLYQAYCQEPSLLPPDQQQAISAIELRNYPPSDRVKYVVGQYIAGMTDRYLKQEAERVGFEPRSGASSTTRC